MVTLLLKVLSCNIPSTTNKVCTVFNLKLYVSGSGCLSEVRWILNACLNTSYCRSGTPVSKSNVPNILSQSFLLVWVTLNVNCTETFTDYLQRIPCPRHLLLLRPHQSPQHLPPESSSPRSSWRRKGLVVRGASGFGYVGCLRSWLCSKPSCKLEACGHQWELVTVQLLL